MNKVTGIDGDTLLKTADLAARAEFRLGEAIVFPGTRTVRGPGGEADLEPRVMQVLIVLSDAAGSVVTRETLFQRCWGNVYVGDDSLNRAVGGVRKVAENIAGGSFVVETVPRTGYRLIVKSGTQPARSSGDRDSSARSFSRRRALFAGGAAAAAAAGAGSWLWLANRPDPRFVALMEKGEKALLSGAYDDPNVIALYQEAVRLEPGSAKAWGLLAFFRCTVREDANSDSAQLTEAANQAIQQSLAIDPTEPNARMAHLLLEGPMLDWTTRDRRIREILSTDPLNIPAMRELMMMLQAAGLTRESWSWNERILELAPLSRPHLIMRAMKLWILGRTSEADKVIDRARGLWPLDEFAYFVRLMLFALTDRPQAGVAMLDSPPNLIKSPERVALWRTTLRALEERSPETIETARLAFFEAASKAPWQVNMSVMVLCKLGLVDAAFELADGYLLWRGKIVSSNQSDPRALNDYNRRMTPWLFTPPVAVMRSDRRFMRLCEEFGLAAYWRARGVKPDYMTA